MDYFLLEFLRKGLKMFIPHWKKGHEERMMVNSTDG
jgi:hypothetical protein